MNLRLDSRSIRVRMDLEEAVLLEAEGSYSQEFSTPQGSLRINVQLETVEGLELTSEGPHDWGMRMPRSILETLVAAARSGRGEKDEWEWKATASVPGGAVEVRIEIDRWSKKRRGGQR